MEDKKRKRKREKIRGKKLGKNISPFYFIAFLVIKSVKREFYTDKTFMNHD